MMLAYLGTGRGLRTVLLGLLTLLASACTQVQAPPMRVGVNLWPGYEPLFLARELGYYPAAGVHLVEYTADSQALRAYRNGALEGLALTLDETLRLAAVDPSPRIVAVLDLSYGADVVVARPEIQSLGDLKGKRVGVEYSGLGAFFLSRVLAAADLRQSDIELVPVELGAQVEAFRSGRVDALVTAEPGASQLIAEGARRLFDSRQIPGEIVDVLVVSADYIERHPERVQSLVQGWLQALGHLRQDREDALARMAAREGISPGDFAFALDGLQIPGLTANRALLSGEAPGLLPTLNRLESTLREVGLLQGPIDAPRLLEPRFLLEAN